MCLTAFLTFIILTALWFTFWLTAGLDCTGVWLLIGIFAAIYLGRKWYGKPQGSN